MDGQDVVAAVHELVATGEYLDELFLRPGVQTEGRGPTLQANGGPARRLVTRGSDEHLAARAAGELDPLPPLTPASADAVADTEGRLGRPLPEPLRTLVLTVGNGGFGPGYGVLGVGGGHTDDRQLTGVDMLDPPLWSPPPGVMLWPLCHWGCAIYSLVDCASPDATIWAFDPNLEDVPSPLFPEPVTLTAWFQLWLNGALHQPAVVDDPDTGAIRAATPTELAEMWAEQAAW